MKTAIPQAIAEGGTKLDCYGPALVKICSGSGGFIPVARVTFNPEFANPGWTQGMDTQTYESRYGKSTASHPDRSSVSANDPTEVYHGTSSGDSIPQTAQDVNPETGIPQAAAQGQTAEQGDKMDILGEDGTDLIGKSAGEAELSEPGEPVQIRTVDFADKKTVLEQLDFAQKETADLDHEVNYSVTTDGKVWRVSGESGTVDLSAIPSSLVGSYAYHNHPARKTMFSFSADDVRFFFKSGEEFSKASDHVYEEILKVLAEQLEGFVFYENF